MVRRWLRFRVWARRNRVGFWLVVLLGLGLLGYVLALFTEALRHYGPTDYEPKDMERRPPAERKAGP